MGPDAALAACRFVHDAAAMLLWGSAAFLAALVPPRLGRDLGGRLKVFGLCAAALAGVTTLAALPIEAASIGEGWADALDPAMVRAVLFDTGVGAAWRARGAAALLLAATPLVPTRWRCAATALAAGLLLSTLALTGHAAMDEGWAGAFHRFDDALHLLAGGAWLGALVPLPLVLERLDDPRLGRDAALALRRFSTAGHGAVALVIATGVVNTALVLKRWPTDWSSPYQALLAAKVTLVLAMTALALLNRYFLVPRLGRCRARSLRALRRSTLLEIALGVAAIGCVALFGLREPV